LVILGRFGLKRGSDGFFVITGFIAADGALTAADDALTAADDDLFVLK
jgi:hypothetical protein